MNIQTIINFITENNRNLIFLCTGDYDYLKENILHNTEFYVGMEFIHKDQRYEIESFNQGFGQNGLVSWGQNDSEVYYGNPCQVNFDVYINCIKL